MIFKKIRKFVVDSPLRTPIHKYQQGFLNLFFEKKGLKDGDSDLNKLVAIESHLERIISKKPVYSTVSEGLQIYQRLLLVDFKFNTERYHYLLN